MLGLQRCIALWVVGGGDVMWLFLCFFDYLLFVGFLGYLLFLGVLSVVGGIGGGAHQAEIAGQCVPSASRGPHGASSGHWSRSPSLGFALDLHFHFVIGRVLGWIKLFELLERVTQGAAKHVTGTRKEGVPGLSFSIHVDLQPSLNEHCLQSWIQWIQVAGLKVHIFVQDGLLVSHWELVPW